MSYFSSPYLPTDSLKEVPIQLDYYAVYLDRDHVMGWRCTIAKYLDATVSSKVYKLENDEPSCVVYSAYTLMNPENVLKTLKEKFAALNPQSAQNQSGKMGICMGYEAGSVPPVLSF